MTRRVSSREARSHFAELTDRVRYTGEPVIVEKQGHAFVAVVSIDDLDALDRLRRDRAEAEFTRLASLAAEDAQGPEPSEDDIVAAVKRTRERIPSDATEARSGLSQT